MSLQDTIVALASAPGRASVAVLRVSGPKAQDVMYSFCQTTTPPAPRQATLASIVNRGEGGAQEVLDKALIVWFPAPHSFTGEDVLELHLHGGRSVVRETLEALCSVQGVRPAEPGEFSRRAFENGKMDLTEAEGIADLVDAETGAQRKQALRQMDGELGRLYNGWAERLTHDLAYIEAEIDFADEEVPEGLSAGQRQDIGAVKKEIEKHLDDAHRGERLREGFVVAILGAPNAGKSSLLNALTRREAAIVSPLPGTTRDVVEVQLDLGGYPVSLADTAGLRETIDSIESEGVRRALHRAEQADFKLLVFDGGQLPTLDTSTLELIDDAALVVINKNDLCAAPLSLPPSLPSTKKPVFVSAQTGEGLKELTTLLVEEIERRFVVAGQPALTRARHRAALEECLDHLRRAETVRETELFAEDIRLAVRALGRITGSVDVEDLLDIIFSSFCIGK